MSAIYRSIDGGRTFSAMRPPHGDNHDLWIAPDDPQRMIEGNDGGANDHQRWRPHLVARRTISRPRSFTAWRSTTIFPYHIYGAQQDNTTVRIASRTDRRRHHRQRIGTTWAAAKAAGSRPIRSDSQIVYAGSYDNLITRQDHRTGQMRNINAWPDNPMGYGAEALKYRFQWSFPIAFSPHDPKTLYIGSNVMMKTTNEGQNWEAISPDLTRNDKSKTGYRRAVRSRRTTPASNTTTRSSPSRNRPCGQGPDLGRVGRRPGAPDARRRQELGKRHAQGHAGMDPDQFHRRFAVRCRDGLRRGHSV